MSRNEETEAADIKEKEEEEAAVEVEERELRCKRGTRGRIFDLKERKRHRAQEEEEEGKDEDDDEEEEIRGERRNIREQCSI